MNMSTALSGLDAASAALNTVSNNLANMNTDGYKSQTTTFSDLFYQALGTTGSGDPIEAGMGVQVSGTTEDFSTGALSSTGISSNMALNGSGFFVAQGSDGQETYTRDGDFTTNASGQLTTLSGELVMGYPAENGVVSTNATLLPINVGSAATLPASPTTSFSLNANLDAGSSVGDTFQSPVTVYDSLGTSHVLTVTYTNTGANTWSYNVTIPSSDIQGGTGTSTTLASGTLSFDSTGQLSSPTGTIPLSIGSLADGAVTLNPTWQLTDSNGNSLITQTASASSNNASTQNGFAAGVLSSYSVLSDGTVQATFSNGQTSAIGQVAVANFANPEGLLLNGDDEYTATLSSGSAVVGTAGTGGRGTIVGSEVEESNVDVAAQFSDLIVYQRAYEANAKAITAFDQLEEDTIQMKS